MQPDKVFSCVVGGKTITAKSGRLAEQAGGAVTLTQGESVLMALTTMSRSPRAGLDFFPLSVDYEEKLYAAGRIPGSFFKREGRPTTKAILTSRLTDRPLRPLFPKGMRNDVQVIITALSSDSIVHLDVLAVNAASCALHCSNIPWNGPIAAIRVGYIDGQLVANPDIPDMDNSTLNLRVAGSKDAIIMVEADAKEVPEALMVEALAFAHEQMQPLITMQEEMRAVLGKEKTEVELKVDADNPMLEPVTAKMGDRLFEIISTTPERHERSAKIRELTEELVEHFTAEAEKNEEEIDVSLIYGVIQKMTKAIVRDRILIDGIRPDGRKPEDVRELSSEVALWPRTHGSEIGRAHV